MAQGTRLRMLGEEAEPIELVPGAVMGHGVQAPSNEGMILSQIITGMISLQALSLKATIAVSNCFTLVALLCVGGLWYELLRAPTTEKLVGGGMFSAFVLAIEFIRRRK